jgi:ribonuclease HI
MCNALETVEKKQNKTTNNLPKQIFVFTDSQSAVGTSGIGKQYSSDLKETTLLEHTVNFLMNTYDITLTFQQIPGHVGISGNENADRLVRKGASMDQHERPVNYDTIRNILRNN